MRLRDGSESEVERIPELMHEADQKPIEIFNALIGINNNRIECYTFAAKETDAPTFRVLFTRLVETSLACNEALVTEVYKLGGVPYQATLGTSGFFRAWLSVHAALMNNSHKDLIEACFEAESIVQAIYSALIEKNHKLLNSFQHTLLGEQLEQLNADRGQVNNLRCVFTRAA